MRISSRPAARSCARADSGSVLVGTLLVIWLLLIGLLGTAWIIRKTHRRTALQSRLDICAVRLAEARKNLLADLTHWNLTVQATKYGIYAVRGVKLLGPGAAALGGMGEIALLQMNRAAALAQEASSFKTQAKEFAGAACAPTPYSRETAFCLVTPATRLALTRTKTIFADVRGPLRHAGTKRSLAEIRCRSLGNAETRIAVAGDPELFTANFTDRYEK